jgi:hypothetical protein
MLRFSEEPPMTARRLNKMMKMQGQAPVPAQAQRLHQSGHGGPPYDHFLIRYRDFLGRNIGIHFPALRLYPGHYSAQ